MGTWESTDKIFTGLVFVTLEGRDDSR
jgi:hypothetical protein